MSIENLSIIQKKILSEEPTDYYNRKMDNSMEKRKRSSFDLETVEDSPKDRVKRLQNDVNQHKVIATANEDNNDSLQNTADLDSFIGSHYCNNMSQLDLSQGTKDAMNAYIARSGESFLKNNSIHLYDHSTYLSQSQEFLCQESILSNDGILDVEPIALDIEQSFLNGHIIVKQGKYIKNRFRGKKVVLAKL
ncbi:hypothetical protein WA158_008376 [Blastocystis sp. Blastoise]